MRTPLYDWHVSHGARMVDFGGWDMPIQYTTITEEHNAVRTAAGLFDVSHMGRLSFGGPAALDLIQYVFTNDAATMKDGQVRYGLICNPQGGIRDDVLVYRWPYGFAMVVNASNREKIVGWINDHQHGRDVQSVDQTLTTAMIAVQGPKAVELCRGLVEADASAVEVLLRRADALPRQELCRQPHRLHRRGRLGVHGRRRPGGDALGRIARSRGSAVRPGSARHAASGSRDAAVRP